MLIIIALLLFVCSYAASPPTPYLALTVAPVAHCAGEPLSRLKSKNKYLSTWNSIPFCGKKGVYACPRIHQILFNTLVTVLEEKDNDVKILITSSYYQGSDQQKCATFWADKESFRPLSTINKHYHSFFPPDFDFTSSLNLVRQRPLISLVEPIKIPTMRGAFSAGTRFVLKNSTPTHFNVYCFNPNTSKLSIIVIPQTHAIEMNTLSSWHMQKACFMQILKRWANQRNGAIPYVWGGCSYIQRDRRNFCEVSKGPIEYYDRPKLQKCGFDCAGLITRAAHTCGIPFYFKNTTTIKNNLKPITQAKNIQDGDIIWVQGHVMVVSSKRKNKLIEARSYGDGYGRVHELPLGKVFKNVTTYEQLMKYIKQKKPIERFDHTGSVKKVFSQALVLSLKSAIS